MKKQAILIEEDLFLSFHYNTPATIKNIKNFSSNKIGVVKAFLDFYILDKNNIDRAKFYDKYGTFLNNKNYEFVLPNKLWDDFKKHLYSEYFFGFLLERTNIGNGNCHKSLLDYSKLYYISYGKLTSPFSLLPEFIFHFENNNINIYYNTDRFDGKENNDKPATLKLFKNNKLNLDIFKYLNNVIDEHKDLITYNFEKQINYQQSYLLISMLNKYSTEFIKDKSYISPLSFQIKILQEKNNILTQYMPIIKISIPEYKFEYHIDLKKVCFHSVKKPYTNQKENKPLFEHYKVFLRDEMNYLFKDGFLKSIIEKNEINKNLEHSFDKKVINKRL